MKIEKEYSCCKCNKIFKGMKNFKDHIYCNHVENLKHYYFKKDKMNYITKNINSFQNKKETKIPSDQTKNEIKNEKYKKNVNFENNYFEIKKFTKKREAEAIEIKNFIKCEPSEPIKKLKTNLNKIKKIFEPNEKIIFDPNKIMNNCEENKTQKNPNLENKTVLKKKNKSK
jgi:hypothetical protein